MNYTDPEFLVLAVASTAVMMLLLCVNYSSERLRPEGPNVTGPAWRRVLGLTSVAPLPIGGFAFPFSALVAVPALLLPSQTKWSRLTQAVPLVAGVGLVVIFASAVVQGAPLPTGTLFALAAFTLFFVATCRTCPGQDEAAQLLAWVSIGTTLFYLVFDVSRTDTLSHLWKYGIGPSVVVLTVYIACQRMTAWAVTFTLVGLSAVSVGLGFRSFGLICLVSAIITVLFKRDGLRRGTLVIRLAAASAGVWLLSWGLPALISAGVFGQEVRRRTLSEDIAGVSPLLAGRVEPPLSLAAIAARPLFGWGNADTIDHRTLTAGSKIASALGMTSPSLYIDLWRRSDGRISLHSILFESWAQGGVLAAVLPVMLGVLFVGALICVRGRYAPMIVLVSAQCLWDLVFSPWNHNRPIIFAVSAVLACHALRERSKMAPGTDYSVPHKPLPDEAVKPTSRRAVSSTEHRTS